MILEVAHQEMIAGHQQSRSGYHCKRYDMSIIASQQPTGLGSSGLAFTSLSIGYYQTA
jgi:hypothetical protein